MATLFSACPYRYTLSERVFADAFRSYQSVPGYMAILSDSLRSGFTASAKAYEAHIQRQWIMRYGRAPASHVSPNAGMSTNKVTCISAGTGDISTGVTTLGATCTYPTPYVLYTGTIYAKEVDYHTIDTSGGWLTLLRPDWGTTNAYDTAVAGGKFMDVSTGNVKLRVYCATKSGSATSILWGFIGLAGDTTSNTGTSDSDTVAVAADSATFGIVTADIESDGGTWNRSTAPYPEFRLYAGESGKTIQIVGTRFLDNTAGACGLTTDHFCGPGYTSATFLANHGNCMEAMYRLGPFDIFYISFGTNDNGGVALATYKANTEALISAIRTKYRAMGRDPLFILAPPPAKTSAITDATIFNQYAGELYAIAQADPMCLFINLRRATEDAGFTAGNPNIATDWLSDGTHWTAPGQRMVAEIEAALMCGTPRTSGPGLKLTFA